MIIDGFGANVLLSLFLMFNFDFENQLKMQIALQISLVDLKWSEMGLFNIREAVIKKKKKMEISILGLTPPLGWKH